MMRSIWHLIVLKYVIDKMPVPTRSASTSNLVDMSAQELERIVRAAFTLRRSWTSPIPDPIRSYTISTSDLPSSHVLGVSFIRHRRRSYLLSASHSPPVTGIQTIECWDLEVTPPVCVGRRRGSRLHYTVNTNPDADGFLAVKTVNE